MGRFLFWLLIGVAVVWWLRRPPWERRASMRKADAAPPPPPLALDNMVACDLCGVHLPQQEAVPGAGAGRWYCSDTHRRQGRQASRADLSSH